jgi:Ca2+-binding RTX toxin-like protein
MDGGSGNDRLIDAGGGNILMTGGSGADTFDFHSAGHNVISHDEITDFNFAEGDRIDFSGSAYVHQMSDIHVGHDAHGNAMLTFTTESGTGTVVLDHIHAAAVNSSMFSFSH